MQRVYIMMFPKFALAVVAVAVALAACGGDDEPDSGITEVEQLRGQTIGVFATDAISTLQLRYVLQESYGLEVPSDVRLVEAPSSELLDELRAGNVDAVVLPPSSSRTLFDEDEFRVLLRVTQEMRDSIDDPVTDTVLLSYPDVASQKPVALLELNRMLRASMAYLDSYQADVVEEVALERETDEESAKAWWGPRRLAFGDISDSVQVSIMKLWQAASLLGDIDQAPDIAGFVIATGEAPGVQVPENNNGNSVEDTGDRVTLALAFLNDVSRRSALYAIERGIVTSDTVDLDITYLPRRELGEAVAAREFDVVEGAPLAVPLGIDRGLELVIVSGGLQDLDGTVLLVRID